MPHTRTARERFRLAVRRFLVYSHRWLGMLLGGLFAAWFVSGIVLMYAGMPRLSEDERYGALPVLRFDDATVAPADAARAVAAPLDGLRLGMVGGRPAFKFGAGARIVYADDGAKVQPFDAEQALAEVRRFAPHLSASVRYDGYLREPDQWTLETSRLLPAHRVALGDAQDSRVYVAAASGEIILKTTGTARRWAYPGAILHWLYLTPIRRHAAAWAQMIIWSSMAGTLMCVAGLVWGVWRFSPQQRFRVRRSRSRTPYAGWMRWHHYLGLIGGLATLTWVFSGMLSMDPWDWHPSTTPTAAQRLAFAGGALRAELVTLPRLQRALRSLPGARVAEVVQFRGEPMLATDRGLAMLADGAIVGGHLDRDAVRQAAANALPGTTIADVTWLDRYDAYYYSREGALPLPIVRVRYDDAVNTWLYVDPARGTVARKEERLTRVNRWLYHGLHSLDFPFLYYRRPLWDLVVIGLSVAGLALSVTTLVPAWRRVRRHVVKRRA